MLNWEYITLTSSSVYFNDDNSSTTFTTIYTGEPVDVMVFDEIELTGGTHYGITYTRNGSISSDLTNVGTVTVKVTGIGSYFNGTVTKYLTINQKTITSDMLTLSTSSATYTGSSLMPTITVADGTAMTSDDYTLTYTRNSLDTSDWTNAGIITITITGKNNYTGTVSKTFTIERKIIRKQL